MRMFLMIVLALLVVGAWTVVFPHASALWWGLNVSDRVEIVLLFVTLDVAAFASKKIVDIRAHIEGNP